MSIVKIYFTDECVGEYEVNGGAAQLASALEHESPTRPVLLKTKMDKVIYVMPHHILSFEDKQ